MMVYAIIYKIMNIGKPVSNTVDSLVYFSVWKLITESLDDLVHASIRYPYGFLLADSIDELVGDISNIEL